ncbi:MAG: hypothetical protein K6G16_02335 [Lachnospiraceae bacterium]|nr:hypothetical protein [Lachnospiraceae bacterium]
MADFHVYTPLLLIFWLILVPLLAGFSLSRVFPDQERTAGFVWVTGLLLSFVIFEPIALVCMLRIVYDSFVHCARIYGVVMLLLAAVGLAQAAVIAFRHRGEGVSGILCAFFPGYLPRDVADLLHPRRERTRVNRRFSSSELLYTVCFLLLLAVQLFLALYLAPFDGDDAYYVVQSLQSQQTDTIHTLAPYIGYSTSLDFRHAMAEYTVWIAFIARACGIHATILSHTVLPLFWIPLHYAVCACCGQVFLRERRDLVPLFLCFLSIFAIFGNVSIYTPETFFLMRTWQGKSMVVNFLLPLVLLLFLKLGEQEQGGQWQTLGKRERLAPWLLLFLANCAAGFFSTSGILLVSMFTVGAAFFVAVLSGKGAIRHRLSLIVFSGLTCVPGAALVLLSLVFRPW